ncbi:MAG: DivIVA domain-containing protein [Desulfotomaculaceae bacterium]
MLTPLDIQNKEFKRAFRGYSMEDVDQFLDQLVHDYEALYLENQTLRESLDVSEATKTRYQDMEKIIKDTIIIAQKNAEELKGNAKREADIVMEEARLRAEKILSGVGEKAARTLSDAREQARYRVVEAEDRIRSILEEYRFLEMQTKLFRVKFRAFLEAQLKLMENQDEEAHDMLLNAGLSMTQVAAGLADGLTQADEQARGTGTENQWDDELPAQKERGHTSHIRG